MKKISLYSIGILFLFSSCNLLSKIGIGNGKSSAKQEGGCPSNGKNVGAEKLLSSDGKVIKSPKYTKGKSITY